MVLRRHNGTSLNPIHPLGFEYLETINIWGELSDVSNAQRTLNRTSETSTTGTSDVAKIKKDAEKAIKRDAKKVNVIPKSVIRTIWVKTAFVLCRLFTTRNKKCFYLAGDATFALVPVK